MEATGEAMTHQEIIDSIVLNIADKCPERTAKGKCNWGCWNCELSAAMLAVLDIHQPKSSEYFEKDVCVGCTVDIDYYEYYPCKTIQAIEKAFA